jgi:hypothetical protein
MDGGAVAWLVVLSSGFAYSVISLPTLYFSAREVGHRLYFRSAIYAVFTLASTLLAFITAATFFDVELPLTQFHLLPSELLGGEWGYLIQIGTLPVAMLLAFIVNVIFQIPKAKEWLLAKAVSNRDFEKLVLNAARKSIPIMVSMIDGKLYVGWAVSNPDPSLERKFLRILPLISGYRTEKTKRVEFTTYYDEIIEAIRSGQHNGLGTRTEDDIEVVLPSDSIVSAHLFDLTIYDLFMSTEDNLEAEVDSPETELIDS